MKRPYETPTLDTYGHARELTLGSSGPDLDIVVSISNPLSTVVTPIACTDPQGFCLTFGP